MLYKRYWTAKSKRRLVRKIEKKIQRHPELGSHLNRTIEEVLQSWITLRLPIYVHRSYIGYYYLI